MSDEPEWHRPHPLTIVVSIVGFVADNALPLVFVIAAGGAGAGFELIGFAAGLLTVGYGVGRWYVTRYALTSTTVEHRSGIINRQARSIPLDRIQQVAVAEPVVARVFGLAAVQISEASADGDVAISYLGVGSATELTETLRALARARDAGAGSTETPDGATEGDSDEGRPSSLPPPQLMLHQTDTGDLVRYQLAVSAPGLAVAVAAVAAIGVLVGGLSAGAGATFGGGVVASVIVLGLVVVSAIGPIITLGGFELRRGDRGLTVDMGLLSRRHLEVRPDRIQTVTVASGPLARRMELHQVVFSAAVGAAVPTGQVTHLGPAVRTESVDDLLHRAVDLESGFATELEPVSRLTVRRFLVRATLLWSVTLCPGGVALVARGEAPAAVLLSAAWFGIAAAWALGRHRRLGVAVDEDRVVFRHGVLVHRLTQLASANAQVVVVRSSWFQHRMGLADLVVSTAGVGPSPAVRVPDLPVARAEELARQVARVAASTRWELVR